MTTARTAAQIVQDAIATVADLRTNKAGNDLDGNAVNGLERSATRALAKVLGFEWKKRTAEQYQQVFTLMAPVREAIAQRVRDLRK